MFPRIILSGLFLLLFSTSHAAKVADIEIPENITVEQQPLTLNGAGARTKLFIKAYVGSLFLTEKSNNAMAIISSDKPMSIHLNITSGLLTAEKMTKATIEGFENSTGGNIAPLKNEIDTFINIFKAGIEKGDHFNLNYLPTKGTMISKNGKVQENIPGLAFKKALFGIWLSDKPAQESLKKAMLGN